MAERVENDMETLNLDACFWAIYEQSLNPIPLTAWCVGD